MCLLTLQEGYNEYGKQRRASWKLWEERKGSDETDVVNKVE